MLDTHYLIQLDVMYKDGHVTEGTAEFLQMLDVLQIPYTIVTEQSGRSREQIASALQEAGLSGVRADEIYTSSMAAVDYAYHQAKEKKAFICGGKGIGTLLAQTGFELSYTSPEFVFFGLNKELMYSDYCDVLDMVLDGAVMLSTDSRLTQEIDGRTRIGSAAIVHMLEAASGKDAMHFGRGSDLLYRWLLKYIQKTTAEVTVVGNDFAKDILTSARLGIRNVYVADNDEGAEALMTSSVHPDYIVENLAGLAR